MKIALSLELSDEQRNTLTKQITRKDIKRLATRDEIRAYVEGCLGALTVEAGSFNVTSRSEFAHSDEAAIAEKLRAEGKSEGYIRGFINAGRRAN